MKKSVGVWLVFSTIIDSDSVATAPPQQSKLYKWKKNIYNNKITYKAINTTTLTKHEFHIKKTLSFSQSSVRAKIQIICEKAAKNIIQTGKILE